MSSSGFVSAAAMAARSPAPPPPMMTMSCWMISATLLSAPWFLLFPEHLEERPPGIKVVVRHALLEGDDGVIGDVDVLRANLLTALGDVAEPDPPAPSEEVGPR